MGSREGKVRLKDRDILEETNQGRRKGKTEKGRGHHEARWIMSLWPGGMHSEDKLMKQKQPGDTLTASNKGHMV